MKYSCLILARNEEGAIGATLAELARIFAAEGLGQPEIVVSDDSEDRTGEISRSLGARVVPAGGVGLGRAYVVGLQACIESAPDRIFVIDGDGQADLGEIPEFIREMDRTEADLVTGSRFLERDSIAYRYSPVHRFGSWLLSAYLTWATRQKFTDSHGGLRLMTLSLARAQRIRGVHTYVQESIIDAVGRGYRVTEISSRWRKRTHGSSRVVRSIVRYALRTSPYLLYRAWWITGRRRAL